MSALLSASGPRSRRFSGWLLTGLVISCLAFSARGLLAQGKEKDSRARSGTSGRVVPNAGAQMDVGEPAARKAQRPSRSPADERPAQDERPAPEESSPSPFPAGFQPEQLVAPGGLGSTVNLLAATTVLSLVPSILIMTTCFVRFIIVTSLLRQALGTQQLPPNNVLTALCLFLTFFVMSPIWQQSYDEGIRPYTQPAPGQAPPSLTETFEKTVRPVRQFMFEQIESAHNEDALILFLDYQHPESDSRAREHRYSSLRYKDVSLPTLVSAYILSELKVAFVIGFQIFLPFLVIDMVVSTVLMSMGMMMLPPTLVSFPFKLLLFVLIDGWVLTVGMLLDSVRPTG